MKFSIKTKLGLAFGLILVLMTASSLLTYSLIIDNEKTLNNVVDLRLKTVLLGKDVTNGINKSLAGLRGYMLLGDDPEKGKVMQAVRSSAWVSIEAALQQYSKLAVNWTVPANINRLKAIKAELAQFKMVQQEIENISHSQGNIIAYQLLLEQAAPRATKMLTSITQIIDEEAELSATPSRKTLLKNLADVRGSFAIGLANIRAFLLSGSEEFQLDFTSKWQINNTRVEDISNNYVALFTKSQLAQWQIFMNLRAEFTELPPKMFALRTAVDWNKANYQLQTQAAPKAAKVLSLLEQMKVSQDTLLNNDIAHSQALVEQLKTTLVLATIISVIIAIVCGLLFSRDLVTRLQAVLSHANKISAGDMSSEALPIKGSDELAELTGAVNSMSDSLLHLIQRTADSMGNASKGTIKILVANQEMAVGISQQTLQVEQIAAAVEELSNSSLEVASNCTGASDSSIHALALAREGGQINTDTLAQMVSIKEAFDNSATAVGTLSEQSNKIGDIVNVIKSIADQTNLLALNAAIEAARAGEQGRGFSVVADEVRQLANRTTEATREVELAIETMSNETNNAVNLMENGKDQVDQGVSIMNGSVSSSKAIIDSVDDVVAKIQAIAATAEEQSMTTAEIAQNTESVSAVSQQIDSSISNVVSLSNAVTNTTQTKAGELLAMF